MDYLLSKVNEDMYIGTTIVIISLVVLVIKIVPKIVRAFQSVRKELNKYENLHKDLCETKDLLEKLDEELGTTKTQTKRLQRITNNQQAHITEAFEERELILKSLLGVVQGLQEIGANGPTKIAEKEIQNFLLRKAHKAQMDNLKDGEE